MNIFYKICNRGIVSCIILNGSKCKSLKDLLILNKLAKIETGQMGRASTTSRSGIGSNW